MADTKPIELSLLPPSDEHDEGRREVGEGYSMAVPHEELTGIVISECDRDVYWMFDMTKARTWTIIEIKRKVCIRAWDWHSRGTSVYMYPSWTRYV